MPLPMIQESSTPKIKTILAIAAGKGGVGKSTITVNLARELKRKGFSVGILDADVYGPSIRKMLPEERLPQKKGETLVPAVSGGIKILSMAYFREDDKASVVRAPIANGIVLSFINQADWGELDYLLIDFPPGTGDIQLTIAQNVKLKGALLCTTPQEVAQLDVKKAARMFEQVNISILGVVENMSYYLPVGEKTRHYIFGKGGGKKLALTLGVPFLGEIPIDPSICSSGDLGEELSIEKSAPFTDLAEKTLFQLEQQTGTEVKVERLNPHAFQLAWPDGLIKEYTFSDLQKNCPCASCVDETTGKRVSKAGSVDPMLQALKIDPVGRYGIRIKFTSGCSDGIYGFDHLRIEV